MKCLSDQRARIQSVSSNAIFQLVIAAQSEHTQEFSSKSSFVDNAAGTIQLATQPPASRRCSRRAVVRQHEGRVLPTLGKGWLPSCFYPINTVQVNPDGHYHFDLSHPGQRQLAQDLIMCVVLGHL
jgi:hypothetical protein